MSTSQCCAPTEAAPQAQEVPTRRFRAAVDVVETSEALVVAADVPGASAESVEVSFQTGVLTLSAKVPPRNVGRTPLLREYGVGDYRRELRVGEGIDAERISAQLKEGVLTVVLPKLNGGRPRKIPVA